MLKKISPDLAFSVNHHDSEARLQWARKNAYAVEYSPDPERLDLLPGVVQPFVEAGIPVRFHTRYFQYELGHADMHMAAQALEVHARTLETIKNYGQSCVTVHTGLVSSFPVKEMHILDNLSRLVEYAAGLGMNICLENLRTGHASDPYRILNWAGSSGAMITMDVGHALGCPMVMENEITPADIVELFASRLYEVHVYGKEDEFGHHPIRNVEPLAAVLGSLLQTDCRWWTIELDDQNEAMATRDLLEKFLEAGFDGFPAVEEVQCAGAWDHDA